MPQGGVLLDGNGDIALCDSALESVRDIVRSRLKADLNGWQLYPIGADLQSQIGEMAPDELESAVQRLVRTRCRGSKRARMTRCRAPLAPISRAPNCCRPAASRSARSRIWSGFPGLPRLPGRALPRLRGA